MKTPTRTLSTQPSRDKAGRQRGIDVTALPSAFQEQVRAQIGDAAFEKLHKKQEGGHGRIRVVDAAARTVDGIVFASGLEARVYARLKAELGAGRFSLQPVFLLQAAFIDATGKKVRPIHYKADFLIGPPRASDADPVLPSHIVIDAKGFHTEMWLLKSKIFRYRYKCKLFIPRKACDLDEVFRCIALIKNV